MQSTINNVSRTISAKKILRCGRFFCFCFPDLVLSFLSGWREWSRGRDQKDLGGRYEATGRQDDDQGHGCCGPATTGRNSYFTFTWQTVSVLAMCVCVLVFSLDRQAARSGHTMGTVVNIRFAHLFLPQTRTGPTHGRSCIGAESELVAAVWKSFAPHAPQNKSKTNCGSVMWTAFDEATNRRDKGHANNCLYPYLSSFLPVGRRWHAGWRAALICVPSTGRSFRVGLRYLRGSSFTITHQNIRQSTKSNWITRPKSAKREDIKCRFSLLNYFFPISWGVWFLGGCPPQVHRGPVAISTKQEPPPWGLSDFTAARCASQKVNEFLRYSALLPSVRKPGTDAFVRWCCVNSLGCLFFRSKSVRKTPLGRSPTTVRRSWGTQPG